MSKHTPGPWTYDRNQETFTGADGASVMTLGDCWPQGGDPNEWDAALIASAPDLLEALEWICARQDWTGDKYPDLQWWDRAQKAIAKARGEG